MLKSTRAIAPTMPYFWLENACDDATGKRAGLSRPHAAPPPKFAGPPGWLTLGAGRVMTRRRPRVDRETRVHFRLHPSLLFAVRTRQRARTTSTGRVARHQEHVLRALGWIERGASIRANPCGAFLASFAGLNCGSNGDRLPSLSHSRHAAHCQTIRVTETASGE